MRKRLWGAFCVWLFRISDWMVPDAETVPLDTAIQMRDFARRRADDTTGRVKQEWLDTAELFDRRVADLSVRRVADLTAPR